MNPQYSIQDLERLIGAKIVVENVGQLAGVHLQEGESVSMNLRVIVTGVK